MMQLKLGHCQAFFSFLHNISIPPIAVLPLSENLSINSALQHFCRVVIIPRAQGVKSAVVYKAALHKAVQSGSAKGPEKHHCPGPDEYAASPELWGGSVL